MTDGEREENKIKLLKRDIYDSVPLLLFECRNCNLEEISPNNEPLIRDPEALDIVDDSFSASFVYAIPFAA